MHLARPIIEKFIGCINLSPQGRQEDCAMNAKEIKVIFIGILFITMMTCAPVNSAEVNVSIGIGVPAPQVVIPAPPPVVVPAPPPVVVIPGTYVYFALDFGVDIFFYHGYWYRPHYGHWYRSEGYNGPWYNIKGRRVPYVVRNLPPDFRHSIRQHERIRHVDLQRNWKTWEKEKHWDRHYYRQEVQGGYYGGWEGNQGRPASVDRSQVWEVRDLHDDANWKNGKNKPKGRGKHYR